MFVSPLAQQRSQASTDMTEHDRPASSRSSQTVLVVDDVSTAREITCRLLADAGFRVYSAACAGQALEILAHARPAIDLVVTDVVMPEVSGVELVRRIRKRWPATRVVFMSGYNSDVLMSAGLERPKVIFIAKPFTQEALLEKVAAALRQAPIADPLETAVPWPFPVRRMREPRLSYSRRLELLREIRDGADSVRGPGSGDPQDSVKARLAEWEELEALRDIKVRVVWETRNDREQLLAAFAVITPSGEKLLGEDYLPDAFRFLARRP
jgi:CheY-like chemotaxis protein